MRKILMVAVLMVATVANAKETDPRVLEAMTARDAAKSAVLEAQVGLARARAKLAAEAAKLAEVKAEVARAKLAAK